MSNQCTDIKPEYCNNYLPYCKITSTNRCFKNRAGPSLERLLINPIHRVGYKESTSNNSKNSKDKQAAAAEKAEADRKRKEDSELAASLKQIEDAKRKEAEAEAERKRRQDSEIEAEVKKIEEAYAAEAEEKELQEAVLSARNQLASARGNSCVEMPFYENKDHSCYMDSVIFTLIAFPSPFLHHYLLEPLDPEILRIKIKTEFSLISSKKELTPDQEDIIIKYVQKIQRILLKIDHELRSRQLTKFLNNVPVRECVSLRRELLKNPFQILQPDNITFHFGNKSQEDVFEFIEALFRTFFIKNVKIIETITYKSTEHSHQTKQPRINLEEIYPVYSISPDEYDFNVENFILSKTVKQTTSNPDMFIRGDENADNAANPHNAKRNTAYKNRKYPKIFDTTTTKTKLEVSGAPQDDFMILNLKRFKVDFTLEDPVPVKNTKAIAPPQSIRLNEDSRELHLNNIIVHVGDTIESGHYVAYFKCNGNWYLYNDMDDRIERIGTYEQLLKHRILNSSKTGFAYNGTVKNNAYLLFYSTNNQRV
jgi:hypothetical protein